MNYQNFWSKTKFLLTDEERAILNEGVSPLNGSEFSFSTGYYIELLAGNLIIFDFDETKAKKEENKVCLSVFEYWFQKVKDIATFLKAPTINTKSGGARDCHFYFYGGEKEVSLPSSIAPFCEIKTKKMRVTLSSKLKNYTLMSGDLSRIPLIPRALIKELKKYINKDTKKVKLESAPEGIYLLSEVQSALSVLKAEDWGDYQEWFKLAVSVRRAVPDDPIGTLELFLEFCKQDPHYDNDKAQASIVRLWALPSFSEGTITGRYLMYEAYRKKHGVLLQVTQTGSVSNRQIGEFIHQTYRNYVYYDSYSQKFRVNETGNVLEKKALSMIVNDDMQQQLNLTKDIPVRKISDCIEHYYRSYNTRSPLLEMIQQERWDGVDRVFNFVKRYVISQDDAHYAQAVFTLFLKGMIHRVLNPGCRFEYLPIFQGPQGANKSSIGVALASLRFLCSSLSSSVRHAVEEIQGKILAEISELEQLRPFELIRLKKFITRAADTTRMPYKETSADYPRRTVFYATANLADYLHDPTGERRFLPLQVSFFKAKECAKDRLQIWAQLVVLYYVNPTEELIFDNVTYRTQLDDAINRAKIYDPWIGDFRRGLKDKYSHLYKFFIINKYLSFDALRDYLFEKGLAKADNWTKNTSRRLNEAMTQEGFIRGTDTDVGLDLVWFWKKGINNYLKKIGAASSKNELVEEKKDENSIPKQYPIFQDGDSFDE